MSSLTAGQTASLRALRRLWPDTPLSLIGATALGIQLASFHRHTYDLDVTVAASLEDIPTHLRTLGGWRRHPNREQEWLSPHGVKVDLIPASPELLAAGYIVWPESGIRMSLLGLRHAFERTRSVNLETGLSLEVAPMAAIAILKMVSYQERPRERMRDLGDIAHILEGYLPDEDPRRFADDVIRLDIQYEEVSSYVLGVDLARMVNPAERLTVESFASLVQNDADGGFAQAAMLRDGPPDWHRSREELLLRLRALRRGLGSE